MSGTERIVCLIEDAEWLLETGETHGAAVAARLGRSAQALEQALYRAGRGDLSRRLGLVAEADHMREQRRAERRTAGDQGEWQHLGELGLDFRLHLEPRLAVEYRWTEAGLAEWGEAERAAIVAELHEHFVAAARAAREEIIAGRGAA